MKRSLYSALLQTAEPHEQKLLSTNDKHLSGLSYFKIPVLLSLVLALNPLSSQAGPVFNVVLPSPLDCESDFYQNIQNTLKRLDLETGLYTSIGDSTNKYNAMGWDQRTDLIYAIDATNQELLVIGDTGVGVSLGVPTPLIAGTVFPHKPYAGTMDADGNLWVHDVAHVNQTDYKGYKINVETYTFEEITFTFTNFAEIQANITDLVYIESTDSMWGLDRNSELYQFHLGTQKVTKRSVTGLPNEFKGYGAGFTFSDGSLYFASNTEGAIYKITDYTTVTPSATFFVDSEATTNNDGAACPCAAPPTISSTPPPELTFGSEGRHNFREINSHIVRQTEVAGQEELSEEN